MSMQFSDPDRAHQADAKKLFEYAREHGIHVLTGTETAEDKMWRMVSDAAKANDYFIRRPQGASCWIAVDKKKIVRPYDWGYISVVSSDEGQSQHNHGPRGIAWLEWEDHDFGLMTQGVMHKLTRGVKPGQPNYKYKQNFGPAARKFGHAHGRGSRLCFLNGDMNESDKYNDVYEGAPFTSAWDELREWPKTHKVGNYDVIGGYSQDRRVEWINAAAYDDSKVYFHADHYLVVATARIKL
jgi:hypothetical protein